MRLDWPVFGPLPHDPEETPLSLDTLGALERTVMDALWSADAGLSAADLRDLLAERELALTTVHTVLTRLEKKGFVVRDRSVRPHRYSPASTREDHVTELLAEVLEQASDPRAVLARFLGGVSVADSRYLRGVLDARLEQA